MSRTKHHRRTFFTQDNGRSTFKKIVVKKHKAKMKQLIKNKDFETVPTQKKTIDYDYY